MFGDADLRVFFRDFGVPVVFNGVSTYSDGEVIKGNLDAPGKDAMFDRASVSNVEYRLELPANAFTPFPASTQAISVDGAQYKVQSSEPLDDGALVELKLRKL